MTDTNKSVGPAGDRATVAARLRQALLTGIDTAAIRHEIAAIDRAAVDAAANGEADSIRSARERAESIALDGQRIDAETRNSLREGLAALRLPNYPTRGI